MVETAFKVVKRLTNPPELRSCTLVALDYYSVLYPPGEWVKASIGGCLVFEHENDAETFRFGTSHWETWVVSVEGKVPLPATMARGWGRSAIEALWSGAETGNRLDPWPKGTKAYKKVKLLRKVCPK